MPPRTSRPSSSPTLTAFAPPSSGLGDTGRGASGVKGLSVQRMTVRYDEPLTVVVDPAERIAAVPRDHTVKGMFIADLVGHLGPKWPAAAAELVAPPRLGRYLPFSDYPRIDHTRLLYAVARARHPQATPAQGARLTTRRDAQVFMNSLVGKALLTPVTNAKGVLLSAPRGYQLVVRAGTVRGVDVGAQRVRLEYRDYAGWVEGAAIGLLEGLLSAYGVRATIEVEYLSGADANYDITW